MLDLLDHNCISAKLFNEHAQGGLGDIPFTHAYPEVWVIRDSDFERGRPLLTNLKKPRSKREWYSAACAMRKTRLIFSFAGSAAPGLNCHPRVKEGPNEGQIPC